jgi:dihydrofolate reductase
MSLSLDGYFARENDDVSWSHSDDEEFGEFTAGNASGGGMLIFGRKTYEMMVSFWPTPQAVQDMPKIAEGMNRMKKVVFSKTLETSDWENTEIVKGDLVSEVRKLKGGTGAPPIDETESTDGDITILGSASLVTQLTEAGLIDQYQFVVVPIALGSGRAIFEGMKEPRRLKLRKSISFKNGNVVSSYEPAREKSR